MSDETSGTEPVAADAKTTQTSDPLVARRRRRNGWFIAAAGVTAGVALVGGGAFAIGTAVAAGSHSLKPAFSLTNSSSARGATANSAALAPNSSKMSGAMMMPYWGGGHTVFSADPSLSSSASASTAYAFDAASVDPEKLANTLAKALGITDAATNNNGSWTAGPTDGSGANVSVNIDGTVSVNYYNPAVDPYSCPATASSAPAPAASGSSGGAPATPVPAPSCSSADSAPLGSTADAISAAKDIVTTMGLNPSDYQWTADVPTDVGASVINVTANQVVDGQLTGLSDSFTYAGGNKLSNFYGYAAPLTSLGSYNVVSPQDAVARLNDPAFGAGFGGPRMFAAGAGVNSVAPAGAPMMKSAVASVGSANSSSSVTASNAPVPSPTPTPTLPPTPSAGSAFSWPVTDVTIVKADLGLAQYYEPNGSVVLIPTYQLTGSDKSTWTVIAVDKSSLDTTVPAN